MLTIDNETKLKDIVAETLGVDAEEIEGTASPATLPSWTSFNHLTLMSAVEEAFGLTLSMEEMTGVKSYADLAATVGRHLG
ncbi:MAG: acyl carrier protein [Capsulimonas sp.]|uniref:acyl carrier protein n=1 Tax=Capsulimonas sp. TaxID=2494211 RepID=UPI003266FFCB